MDNKAASLLEDAESSKSVRMQEKKYSVYNSYINSTSYKSTQ